MKQTEHALAKAKEKYGKQEELLDSLKQEIETIAAEISEMKITKQQKEGQIQVLKEIGVPFNSVFELVVDHGVFSHDLSFRRGLFLRGSSCRLHS